MTETVTISGLREMREALLKKIPAEFQGKTLQTGLVAAARPIIDKAKALAPGKGQSRDRLGRATGILKASIHSEKVRSEKGPSYQVRVIRVRSRRSGKRLREREQKRGKSYTDRNRGSGARYWWYVEFGTQHMPAQPFLRPAFQSQKRTALEAFIQGMKKALVAAVLKARWGTPKSLTGEIVKTIRAT